MVYVVKGFFFKCDCVIWIKFYDRFWWIDGVRIFNMGNEIVYMCGVIYYICIMVNGIFYSSVLYIIYFDGDFIFNGVVC